MEQYDFDSVIDRKNTNSLKYDFAVERGRPADVLPLWVADMDFQAPEPVLAALRKSVDHGIFGYSDVKSDYYDAVSQWFLKRHHWQTHRSWLVKTPGVVFALAMAVRTLTQPKDSILIQPLVYYPFFSVIRDNDRTVIENELIYRNGRYTMDFEDFEQKIVKHQVKLFILCSPHNPVGRVWTLEELQRIGEICLKHGVFVVSDEIHCDFAFEEHPHHVFLAANPTLAEKAIVCTAPSKTFNLAGLQTANIFCADKEIRNKIEKALHINETALIGPFGIDALIAAYNECADWLEELNSYLNENYLTLKSFFEKEMPDFPVTPLEGTYLVWINCRKLKKSSKDISDILLQNGVRINPGRIYGEAGEGFIRINIACPRALLKEGLNRIKKALGKAL